MLENARQFNPAEQRLLEINNPAENVDSADLNKSVTREDLIDLANAAKIRANFGDKKGVASDIFLKSNKYKFFIRVRNDRHYDAEGDPATGLYIYALSTDECVGIEERETCLMLPSDPVYISQNTVENLGDTRSCNIKLVTNAILEGEKTLRTIFYSRHEAYVKKLMAARITD